MADEINDNGCLISTSAVKTLITNIKDYTDSAASTLLGKNTDSTTTMTLHGVKNYSNSAISALLGEDTDSTDTMTLYGVKKYSNSAILNAINSLDVDSTSASDAATAYYISQIKEIDGKITATAVAVEQIYSSTGVKPVSGKSIAAAIASLNSNTTTAASGQVIKGITITDGIITGSDFLDLNPSLSSVNATGNDAQKLKISVGQATSSNIELNKATTTTYGVVKKHFTTSATLSFSTSATSATVSVTGVTTSNTIIVSPLANDTVSVGGGDTLSSWEIWRDAGVRCSGQAANSLIFKADETPAADTEFNVIILN